MSRTSVYLLFSVLFASSTVHADLAGWTAEIKASCQKTLAQTPEDQVACTWPQVYEEFTLASRDLTTEPASLPLKLANGLYVFDLFDGNALSIDARVARWLFAVRFVRQTWPFAQLRLKEKNLVEQMMTTASLSSADGWSTLWSAYKHTDCQKTRECLRARAVILVTLNSAVSKIESNTSLQYMINAATDESTTDLVLGGDIRRTRETLENIVGSFTGSGPAFYVAGAGDTSLLLAKEKHSEWVEWNRSKNFEGLVAPLEPAQSACENLRSKLNSQFTCGGGRFGGIQVGNSRALNRLGSGLAFSLQHVRENLAAVLVPTRFDKSRVALIRLLHEVAAYQTASANLKTLAAQSDLQIIGSAVAADDSLVSSLVNEFEAAYSDARKEGVQ